MGKGRAEPEDSVGGRVEPVDDERAAAFAALGALACMALFWVGGRLSVRWGVG